MNKPIRIELIPEDEHEEDEGSITADELFTTLVEGFQHSQKWHAGDGTVRYTQFINGEPTGPIEVTKAEYAQLQHELCALGQQSEPSDAEPETKKEEAA